MDAQPNKLAYVTGASRGIGEALVHQLLTAGYWVIGLSRTTKIDHPNFKFIRLDLSNLEAVKAFEFNETAPHVLLVNNAGMLGEVGSVGSINASTFERVMGVNTIAPQILMNQFIKTFKKTADSGHILNISSGAGKNAIDGWAAYCASKAALDLFSETIRLEFNLHQIQNWFIHSIAPGVVDTEMQSEIRGSNPSEFKSLDRFIALKEENQLASPAVVAEKLVRVINAPAQFESTILSVRDF